MLRIREGMVMKAQVTVTSPEAKRLIARAAAQLPETAAALEKGRILLKGGTTISAFAEELLGVPPLHISGRILPSGTRCCRHTTEMVPHLVLIENGKWTDARGDLEAIVATMGPRDLTFVGANAIDVHGKAAIMIGHLLGGSATMLTCLVSEGCPIIILAGLEKLIPATIDEALLVAGRKSTDLAMGMAVGLMPVVGKLITEREAIEILADVRATVIGSGGILGAEGATTMVMEGSAPAVRMAFDLIQGLKGARLSADPRGLEECEPRGRRCGEHRSCVYGHPRLLE